MPRRSPDIADRFRRPLLVGLAALMLAVGTAPLIAVDLNNENEAVEARLHDSLEYIASDELEGRGPGTEGIELAADYIAQQFQEMGLETRLFEDGPFQQFTYDRGMALGEESQNRLVLIGPPASSEQALTADGQTAVAAPPQRIALELNQDFTPLAAGGSGQFEGELVFVGYGITDEESHYDDYANLDVDDKVVVMLRREPQQGDPDSVFAGTEPSEHAWFVTKIRNAQVHGAAAVIMVNDEYSLRDERGELWTRREAKLKQIVDAAQELADVAQAASEADALVADEENLAEQRKILHDLTTQLEEIDRELAAAPDALIGLEKAGSATVASQMPVYFARRDAIDPVIQAATGSTLLELESAIDEGPAPHSVALPGWRAEGSAEMVKQQVELHNVVAVLEGEGPFADETVVVGAHYDHLGYGGSGSLSPWMHEIHNGADDNGSGVVTLLEIARELAARDTPPARRIVFIAFSGEEEGLLGSAHYVREPRFPLESTVAMVNLDMVGRMQGNKLTIQGTGTAEEFDALIDRIAEPYDLEISKIPDGYGPSDHTSFTTREIPVLFIFTGLHSDYHRPSDDVEKINFDGLLQVTRLTVDLVDELAASPQRPHYLQTRKPREHNTDSPRPYFGSIPDYSQQADGLALSGVTAGGPADLAGLEAGDVIIRFGEMPVSGIEDYDAALRQHKGGETVEIVVRRGEQELTLQATLEDPR